MNIELNQLAPRERRVLLIGIVALGFILIYFMLWEPFITAQTQLENRVAAQQATLQWMQQAATEIQHLRGPKTAQTQTSNVSLLSLIDKSTRQGLLSQTHKRIESKGQREVLVSFEEVSFTELIRWLGGLYNQHQVQVRTLYIERGQISDQVKVRVMLNQS